MEELPELPFEQVLSYLNLKDRLKARTISRAWRNKFDRYPVNTLCYSAHSRDFIYGKNQLISGAFAANFISSTRFTTFFDTFGQTILSSLKHLRLCAFNLSEEDPTAFTRTLNSFGKLEQLDIIRVKLNQQDGFSLNLPLLTSLQLENVDGIKKLALEAPRLREVKILDCSDLRLKIVHCESVERLLVNWWKYSEVKKLKNLKVVYIGNGSTEGIDSTFLCSLQQLKEVHINDPNHVWGLFEKKQQSGRADLKIYLCGLLLDSPRDPAVNAFQHSFFGYPSKESFKCVTENPSRWADQIPFYRSLDYSNTARVPLDLEVDLLKRYTHLNEIRVDRPVEDVERFLNLLKNCPNIVEFKFVCDQPQDLFDRLPEHSAFQRLTLGNPPSDLDFLFRLKHLIYLELHWSIDSEAVRRAFEELPLLSSFSFRYGQKMPSIEIDQSKQFQVSVNGMKNTTVNDLNAAIEFIESVNPKRRKCKAGAAAICSIVD